VNYECKDIIYVFRNLNVALALNVLFKKNRMSILLDTFIKESVSLVL
jgi:hypothetical protein